MSKPKRQTLTEYGQALLDSGAHQRGCLWDSWPQEMREQIDAVLAARDAGDPAASALTMVDVARWANEAYGDRLPREMIADHVKRYCTRVHGRGWTRK